MERDGGSKRVKGTNIGDGGQIELGGGYTMQYTDLVL